MSARQGDLLAEFVRHVNENKYLVVLEDLSTMEEWNAIRTFFPNRKNGSCIIVSTQQYEVASLSVGHPYQVLHLNQLSAEHSVYAFYKTVSLNPQQPHPRFCSFYSITNHTLDSDHYVL
jgi:hypothetical protein